MPALIKYSFLALGSRLWFLAIYLLFSLTSHLFAPLLPEYLRQSAMLGVWFLLSLINFIIFISDVAFGRGITLLYLPYQQIPQGPGKLIAAHFVMAFTVVLIFIASWVSFHPFASTLMPGGVTLLAAANIFSFSLYVTSISLITLMLVLSGNAAIGQHGAAFLGFLAVLVAIYLLVFQVKLTILGLLAVPLAGLTEGTTIAANILLQTPWNALWRNVIITTAVLILQYMSLTYLLNGRVDVS